MDLPPEIVALLDAAWSGADTDDAVTAAEAWRVRTIHILESEASCYISAADESALENALFLLRRLDFAADAESLRKQVHEIVPLLRKVSRNRTFTWFLDAEPLDALLVAGVFVAQGRGKPEAVRERLPEALHYVQALHEDFRGRAPALPQATREAIGRGFTQVVDALEALAAWLDNGKRPKLEAALYLLRDGGEQVAHAERWRAGLHTPRVNVPVGGDELAALLEAALREDPSWRDRAAQARDTWMPRLRDLAAHFHDQLPLRLNAREELLQETDDALDGLDNAFEAQPLDLETAVRRLEDAFAKLRKGATRLDKMHGSRWEELAHLISGAWFGTVPVLTLLSRVPQLVPEDPPQEISQAVEHLNAYLTSGERLHLQAALECVLDTVYDAHLEREELE